MNNTQIIKLNNNATMKALDNAWSLELLSWLKNALRYWDKLKFLSFQKDKYKASKQKWVSSLLLQHIVNDFVWYGVNVDVKINLSFIFTFAPSQCYYTTIPVAFVFRTSVHSDYLLGLDWVGRMETLFSPHSSGWDSPGHSRYHHWQYRGQWTGTGSVLLASSSPPSHTQH